MTPDKPKNQALEKLDQTKDEELIKEARTEWDKTHFTITEEIVSFARFTISKKNEQRRVEIEELEKELKIEGLEGDKSRIHCYLTKNQIQHIFNTLAYRNLLADTPLNHVRLNERIIVSFNKSLRENKKQTQNFAKMLDELEEKLCLEEYDSRGFTKSEVVICETEYKRHKEWYDEYRPNHKRKLCSNCREIQKIKQKLENGKG